MTEGEIAGWRILVVEDEALIAISIEDTLLELGCAVVGPVARLEEAVELASEAAIDAAILDVTIRGGQVYPVAEVLVARGIPFVFASGYGDWALPEKLRDRPRLMKPFVSEDIQREIGALYQNHALRAGKSNKT